MFIYLVVANAFLILIMCSCLSGLRAGLKISIHWFESNATLYS